MGSGLSRPKSLSSRASLARGAGFGFQKALNQNSLKPDSTTEW